MITKRSIHALDLCAAAIATAVLVAAAVVSSRADEVSPAIDIGDSDLGGVVTGPTGPEAGVWVIAETTDLATKFAKVVVTDERGRYVVPDLPKANYSLWVRGYGLVDSAKVQSAPGKLVNLTAVPAPTAAAAAEYYPGVYWYSLLKIPAASEFPGTGDKGNGIRRVHEDPARLDRHPQELLPVLPCARVERRPHALQRTRGIQQFDRGLDEAPPVRTSHDQHVPSRSRGSDQTRR